MIKLDFIVRAGSQATFIPSVDLAPVALYQAFVNANLKKVRVYDIYVRTGENEYQRFSLPTSWEYHFSHLNLLAELGRRFGKPVNLRREVALRLDLNGGTWIACRPSGIRQYSLQRLSRASRARIAQLHYLGQWKITTQQQNLLYAATSLDMCLAHPGWSAYFPPEQLLPVAPKDEETLKLCITLYLRFPALRTALFEELLAYPLDRLRPLVDEALDDLRRAEAGLRDALQISLFRETPLFE